jgi:lipid II isoglutaminyl synthase (glutamine-hydrolysing)
MIKLATVFPSQLNLNGDQGNLLALRRYLGAAGFEVEIRSLSRQTSVDDVHFVLFGHGSLAAMQSIDGVLKAMDWLKLMHIPGLAVGSGFEYLSRESFVTQKIVLGERESEFQLQTLGALQALGYRNTDSGLPNLAVNDQWICTMLHGPILAKNPVLLDRAAKAAVAAAGQEWPKLAPAQLVKWVENLNRIASQIWQLETDEAYVPLAV